KTPGHAGKPRRRPERKMFAAEKRYGRRQDTYRHSSRNQPADRQPDEGGNHGTFDETEKSILEHPVIQGLLDLIAFLWIGFFTVRMD
ncbi:MAG: hypothetical protein KGI29_08015, partial [Pseudomonadota bacterium]|nr:hypothetical protein [Pseudomonadota bacterium]